MNEHLGTPVVEFALRVMEAPSLAGLRIVVVHDIVKMFGALWAGIVVEDELVVEHGEKHAESPWRFKISKKNEPQSFLEIQVEDIEDSFVLRQQLIELAAVVRRAASHVHRFEAESRLARVDELTGLENRRSLEHFLERAVHRAVSTGQELSVMMVDLDHFKDVNDREGHAAGDEVLRVASEFLGSHLRESDRVARWGGDEFLVVVSGLSAVKTRCVADRLRENFAADSRACGATMSIGIADTRSLPANWGGDAKSLLENADRCLYAGKRAGRNRIFIAEVA